MEKEIDFERPETADFLDDKGAFWWKIIEKIKALQDLQVGFRSLVYGCLVYGSLSEKSQTIFNFEALWWVE